MLRNIRHKYQKLLFVLLLALVLIIVSSLVLLLQQSSNPKKEQSVWQQDLLSLRLTPTSKYYDWLTKPYILSDAIAQHCNNQISVKMLSQQIEGNFWVRRVYLQANDEPWVYATVTAPIDTYYQYQGVFDNLGAKLIGKNFLYQNPAITRSKFSYSYLFNEAQQQYLWSRKSTFYLAKNHAIEIMESFLPSIPEYNSIK